MINESYMKNESIAQLSKNADKEIRRERYQKEMKRLEDDMERGTILEARALGIQKKAKEGISKLRRQVIIDFFKRFFSKGD
jgi:hypothetical protein